MTEANDNSFTASNQGEPPNMLWNNLPQRGVSHFAEDLISAVQQRLSRQSRQWLIAVEGGTGDQKSRFALEIGWRYVLNFPDLGRDERFGVILHARGCPPTQRERQLTPQRPLFSTQAGLQSLLSASLQQAGIPPVAPGHPDPFIEALKTERRVLLIIEELDRVHDEEVLKALHRLPEPAKAIVTTSHILNIPFAVQLSTGGK